MNGKQIKRIRREAREAPVANDPTSYVVVNAGGTVELNPSCTRYLVQQLKKEFKGYLTLY